ncbi:MAG: hypothetical protein FWG14_08065 [Peptococcaceae bacterium]|nr:hypothetical protein [Peptococcaceae bacterium]
MSPKLLCHFHLTGARAQGHPVRVILVEIQLFPNVLILQALLQKTAQELDKIIAGTGRSKYSKEIRIGKVVNKYNMGKFIIFEGEGDTVAYTLNQDQIEQEASLDGCYVIFSDVMAEDMSSAQIVKNYKSLIGVKL